MERSCYKCGQEGGKGARELRPYGPGGKDVCAECVFGSKDKKPDPKLEETVRQEFLKRMMEPGPLLLDNREQVGPRPLKPKGGQRN